MSRRLDEALVERGLANTRSRARALVMAGQVRVDGQVAAKPAMRVTRDAPIAVDAPPPFVSRGGDKLDAALGTPAGAPAWTSAPPPAVSPTACCSGAPPR